MMQPGFAGDRTAAALAADSRAKRDERASESARQQSSQAARQPGRSARRPAGPRAGGRASAVGRGRGRCAPTWRGPARARLRVGVTALGLSSGRCTPCVLSLRIQQRHVGSLGEGGALAVRRGGCQGWQTRGQEVEKHPAGGWLLRGPRSASPAS